MPRVCRNDTNSVDDENAGGAYAFVLRVPAGGCMQVIGALGEIHFRAGYYCYVGSAMNGLRRRLNRHFRRSGKRKHWHIDYLREAASPVAGVAWATRDKAECDLAIAVAELAQGRVEGFGASDCHCPSHLFDFQSDPTYTVSRIRLEGRSPAIRRGVQDEPPRDELKE